MTVPVPYVFEKHELRIIDTDGAPWFVLADVCGVLDIKQSASSARHLDADEKGVHSVHTRGGNQQVTTVNESGLYSLILRSRRPAAKRFKKWVTAEVLPTIRKTGRYGDAKAIGPGDDGFRDALDAVKLSFEIGGKSAAAKTWASVNLAGAPTVKLGRPPKTEYALPKPVVKPKYSIDKNWFVNRLRDINESTRSIARHLELDASSMSRMLAGKRAMKMSEVGSIALFLGVDVEDVLQHAGIDIHKGKRKMKAVR